MQPLTSSSVELTDIGLDCVPHTFTTPDLLERFEDEETPEWLLLPLLLPESKASRLVVTKGTKKKILEKSRPYESKGLLFSF